MTELPIATLLSLMAMLIAPIVHGIATVLLWQAHRRADGLIPALRERLLASRSWTVVAVIVVFISLNSMMDWELLNRDASRWLMVVALWLSTMPSIRFLRMYWRHEFKQREANADIQHELTTPED